MSSEYNIIKRSLKLCSTYEILDAQIYNLIIHWTLFTLCINSNLCQNIWTENFSEQRKTNNIHYMVCILYVLYYFQLICFVKKCILNSF